MATGYRLQQSKATLSRQRHLQYLVETGGELFPFEIPADIQDYCRKVFTKSLAAKDMHKQKRGKEGLPQTVDFSTGSELIPASHLDDHIFHNFHGKQDQSKLGKLLRYTQQSTCLPLQKQRHTPSLGRSRHIMNEKR